MSRTILIRLAVLLVAGAPLSALADSELDQLRAENAHLKTQLGALQESCRVNGDAARAAASPAAPASSNPNATAVAAPSTPPPPQASATASVARAAVAVPAPPAAPAPAAPPAAPAAAAPVTAAVITPAAAPEAPAGYRLVKIDPAVEAQDAENCQHGLFGTTADAPWKHETSWSALSRQMAPAQVDGLLGKNHSSLDKNGRTLWEYGKCGGARALPQAYVVFDRDGLLFWQQPDF